MKQRRFTAWTSDEDLKEGCSFCSACVRSMKLDKSTRRRIVLAVPFSRSFMMIIRLLSIVG